MVFKLKDIDLRDIHYLKTYIRDEYYESNGIIKVFFNLFRKTIKSFFYDVKRALNKNNKKNKHLCFYGTDNQYNALAGIYENLEDAELCSITGAEGSHLPTFIGYIFSWISIPVLIIYFNRYKGNKPWSSLPSFIETNFIVYGFYTWFLFYFSHIKPKSMIMSNDHSPMHRLIIVVCNSLHIPTVYIQHASVTEKFPKLNFTISLLEGPDSFNKYKSKGIESKVYQVGMLKFDGYKNSVNKNKTLLSLGVAVNILDRFDKISELLNHIRLSFPELKIILRPHPRDKRIREFYELCDNTTCVISVSKEESSFDFLSKIDALISSESSIHLEAVLMNVYPIYYLFGENIIDSYGYIKNNLITNTFVDLKKLKLLINELILFKPSVRHRCANYISTYNTNYDGRSTFLVKKILSKELGY